MRKIEVIIREFIWALNQAKKPTTHDLVDYKNDTYYIKSSMTNYNVWDLYKIGVKEPIHHRVKGVDLKIINTRKRFIRVFIEKFNFQKQSWRSIDLKNKIGTRLCYINSDNIKFK